MENPPRCPGAIHSWRPLQATPQYCCGQGHRLMCWEQLAVFAWSTCNQLTRQFVTPSNLANISLLYFPCKLLNRLIIIYNLFYLLRKRRWTFSGHCQWCIEKQPTARDETPGTLNSNDTEIRELHSPTASAASPNILSPQSVHNTDLRRQPDGSMKRNWEIVGCAGCVYWKMQRIKAHLLNRFFDWDMKILSL